MTRHLHFIGIGGVSMQALALWYLREGFHVSGCDAVAGPALDALRAAGVEVAEGHHPSHVQGADVVVHSMAVPVDHPELVAARAAGTRVLRRIELLGELFARRRALAVTGTHGKSTTTAMAATLLLALDPESSVQLGATLPSIQGNMHYGRGAWLAAEVDESDPGFADLRSAIGVVTNLEDDHIAGEFDERRNYHASLADLEAAARRFAKGAECLVYCADWPGLADLLVFHPNAVTYGLDADADYRLTDLELGSGGSTFTLHGPEVPPYRVRLEVPGHHNALNAAAALAAVHRAGFDPRPALDALASFHGVGRRWQSWGEVDGALVIDDYAHHPTEVRATLEAARATGRRVRAVLQPHRWVRTARHWPALAQAAALADEVLVLDVYGAGEAPIANVSPDLIVERLTELGVAAARHDLASALNYLQRSLAPNDLVITLGAGDVWRVAAALVPPVVTHGK
ncbi:MAG: UDP-N-acetylmuramate--L-alanine ligase [Trueperaceae bacterium]